MSDYIAFRRQVRWFTKSLSDEERREIVYIRLFDVKEKYKNAVALDILSKLEDDGVFSPTKPEGLIEIARDINREDLASEVEKFIESQRRSASRARNQQDSPPQAATESDVDMHLRCNLEVTRTLATVLMQNVDVLEQAITAGEGRRQRVEEAIKETHQTSERLTQTLGKMQSDLESDSGSDSSSTDVSPTPDENKAWETSKHKLLAQIQSIIVNQNPPKPMPKPRRSKKHAQEPGPANLRVPVQETGISAQSTTGYMAKTHLQASASESPSLSRPQRLMKPSDKPQSAPSSPSMKRVDLQHTKPAVPPRTLPRRVPATTQLLSARSSATLPSVARLHHPARFPHDEGSDSYVDLEPTEDEELEDTTAGTGDSGYSEADQWRGYMQHPPSRPPKPDSSEHDHRYMSLNRSQMEAPAAYNALQRRDFEQILKQENYGD